MSVSEGSDETELSFPDEEDEGPNIGVGQLGSFVSPAHFLLTLIHI